MMLVAAHAQRHVPGPASVKTCPVLKAASVPLVTSDQVGSLLSLLAASDQVGSFPFVQAVSDQMGSFLFVRAMSDQIGSFLFVLATSDQIHSLPSLWLCQISITFFHPCGRSHMNLFVSLVSIISKMVAT